MALFRVKTVNLTELATGFCGRAQPTSADKGWQRFLRDYEFDYVVWVQVIVHWISDIQPWGLSQERTQWHVKTQVSNILVLALVHRGVAIPLFWLFQPNRSNAYTYQRIVLLQRFRQVFPEPALAFVTAEREFSGQEWLDYLQTAGIRFRLRIREIRAT